MGSCIKCGTRCAGRLCQTHQLSERDDDDDFGSDATCPDCGGPTSAEGATCRHCRGGDR
ncbi:hypothetical protein HZS55_15705 [Halosimplex rubrum]|uniref:Uncharacterized protein n=1 Tax=Halosimplex rubrum TaxID=869889 RepID=A0A7D5P624_9EURY|nr:hypothetical protein [Halosimplex rubrum]QLH78645.1 hypothetical protein HZS55_15705 [Halosimplex rubrum]